MWQLDDKTKHVIFWADNCAAQNKNWTSFSLCVLFVNEYWGSETITSRFYELGHLFMKAAALHGAIEKKKNKTKEVFNCEDLIQLIKNSCKNAKVMELHVSD